MEISYRVAGCFLLTPLAPQDAPPPADEAWQGADASDWASEEVNPLALVLVFSILTIPCRALRSLKICLADLICLRRRRRRILSSSSSDILLLCGGLYGALHGGTA
jgi:hypothetical protein